MASDTIGMPERLREIQDQVSYCRPSSNIESLQWTWKAHAARVRRLVPKAHIEANGEVLYLGQLSPGCQACKQGTWDCVFTTMRCNLDCAFCYSPHSISRDYVGSVFGATPEEISGYYARTQITGVSFSGGEPFLHTDRLFDWISWFKRHYPEKYCWVYTNGVLANEENLSRLADLEVDEVRFNLAATMYDHPTVKQHLSAAVRLMPHVTVEIPSIPGHRAKLLACLQEWCALGVKFLNLHELMYEPGTNSATMSGTRRDIITTDGHRSAVAAQSRALTLDVMRHVQDEALPLSVNDCSLQSKFRQLRGRRRSIAPFVKAPYEQLCRDEVFESYCAYRDQTDFCFFHPASLAEMRRQRPDCRFVRVARTAPLSPRDSGRWIVFERL